VCTSEQKTSPNLSTIRLCGVSRRGALQISPLASALPPRLHACTNEKKYGVNVLWTIFVVLLFLWLLGIATSYTLGGLIHILLVLAVVTVLIRVIQGRRIVS
jgi:hypothetical protein